MAMTIPESFKIATLFPEAAMRVKRPAEPFICVVIEENVSDCIWKHIESVICPSPLGHEN
jgi:hypothetical protein